jgi:thioredoxin-like negative regulator of GroEL
MSQGICQNQSFDSGLPDGLFSNQKNPILVYFGVPWYAKCWDFYDHLEYCTAIW